MTNLPRIDQIKSFDFSEIEPGDEFYCPRYVGVFQSFHYCLDWHSRRERFDNMTVETLAALADNRVSLNFKGYPHCEIPMWVRERAAEEILQTHREDILKPDTPYNRWARLGYGISLVQRCEQLCQ